MTRIYEGTIVPNGDGGNLYLGPSFLQDTACPLRPGVDVYAIAVDGAVVLSPTREVEYPINEP